MSLFISYSSTPITNKEKVGRFVNLLKKYGFSTIWDEEELIFGSDIYSFMEKISTDPHVSSVLIICNKTYVEKANKRKQGVGVETQIITPEVYRSVEQSKFIPISFEKDESDKPYLPKYLENRSYADFSKEDFWIQEMDRLYPILVLRNIYMELVCAKIFCEFLNYDGGTIVVCKMGKKRKYLMGRWRIMEKIPVFDFEIIDKVYTSCKEDLEKFLDNINSDIKYGYFAFYSQTKTSKYGTISYIYYPDEYLPKRDSRKKTQYLLCTYYVLL